MTVFKYSNIITEILIRIVLFTCCRYLAKIQPFMREIAKEELWMYQYPPRNSYVTYPILYSVLAAFICITLIIDYLINGQKENIINALLGLSLSFLITGWLTTFLKLLVGRPRPDFYARCFPDGRGTDLTQCTGPLAEVLNGRKSFPSGHSSSAFCCMVFVSMYLAKKLQLWTSHQGQSWKLILVILPILAALAIAISRTCDYHHHYSDVVGGGLLGTIISYIIFKLYIVNDTCRCDKNESVSNKS